MYGTLKYSRNTRIKEVKPLDLAPDVSKKQPCDVQELRLPAIMGAQSWALIGNRTMVLGGSRGFSPRLNKTLKMM